MPLPPLTHWDETRDNLHQAAQVISALRKAFIKPQPNALHLSVYVTPTGVTTGRLPGGNEFSLDFGAATITYIDGMGVRTPISLENRGAQSTLVALVSSMKTVQFQATQLIMKGGFPDTPIHIDSAFGADYAETLYRVYTAFARFRARLLGAMTPVVVWPHGFDLSTLWFPGTALDEQSQPHCNFGFSPGSAGLPRPYFYAYVWPRPDDLLDAPLPDLAHWHTEGWVGALIEYDSIASESQPESVIESLLEQIHHTLAARMQP